MIAFETFGEPVATALIVLEQKNSRRIPLAMTFYQADLSR
jgi:hypothetical protein